MPDTIRRTEEWAALRAAFELVSQAVFVVDAASERIVDANPAGCELAGHAHGELIGRPWESVAGRLPETTREAIDGDRYVVIARQSAIDGPAAINLSRDPLTGLADRRALEARWQRDATGEPRRLALLFLDLDDFKQVNDTWGHVAGDRVLRIVAQRLSESVRPGDLVVRFGGDEFVVIVEGMSRRRDLERLARRITRAIRQPIALDGEEMELTASIGIAQRSAGMDAIDALVAEADRAMYRCKAMVRASRKTASDLRRPSERQMA